VADLTLKILLDAKAQAEEFTPGLLRTLAVGDRSVFDRFKPRLIDSPTKQDAHLAGSIFGMPVDVDAELPAWALVMETDAEILVWNMDTGRGRKVEKAKFFGPFPADREAIKRLIKMTVDMVGK
jgi:hypothetical protein